MSAPAHGAAGSEAGADFHLYALFHLNLLFSSLEEADRGTVIDRCYRPLLALAEQARIPVGIEASGMTLEIIEQLAPDWIDRLRTLMDEGLAEFVGSGQAQLIGPLAPADVVEANLHVGLETYERLLGLRPRLALVNEQAYSAGLVGHYRRAGFAGIFMDWDGCATHHPEWPRHLRLRPQHALGTDGETIPVLWTSTIAFQKVQRLAHGDMEEADYLAYVRKHKSSGAHIFPVYGNDAEVFDFRPGRFHTEAKIEGGESEWTRIERAFSALAADPGTQFVRPSEALARAENYGAGHPLRLETPGCPIPVKKQHKYNVARWAVTGRDDLAANTRCWQLYRALKAGETGPGPYTSPGWRRLCELWASDYRTHITPARWARFHADLGAPTPGSRRCSETGLAENLPPEVVVERGTRQLRVKTPAADALFDLRKGLSLTRVAFGGDEPVLGTLPHGYYEDIGFGADWFSGTTILETPARPKVTDLAPVAAGVHHDAEEDAVRIAAQIPTPLGPIAKEIRIFLRRPMLKYSLTLAWEEWPSGSLRLGNFTLLPEAFDGETLQMRTHNGGREPERFGLAGQKVDLGAPVSFLVSARSGLGLTEGWIELGDGARRVRIDVDMTRAALMGLVTHAQVDRSFFCRVSLSAMEMDDTRKPLEENHAPRQFEFSVSG